MGESFVELYSSTTRGSTFGETYSNTTKPVPRLFGRVPRWFKLAWNDFKADFKETKWGRGFGWFFLLCLWVCMVMVLGLTPTIGIGGSAECMPDGSFKAPEEGGRSISSFSDDYDVWSPKNPFEVTLRSGEYTFGIVKLIDIIWDLVIGRGGQAFLAYISYFVLIRYLTYQMTVAPISLPTYRRMYTQPELGIRSTIALFHDFIRYRALHSWMGTSWIVFSAVFILMFQTITSAMTSYTPTISPFVKNSDGSWVSYETVSAIDYVIRDASRVEGLNYTDNLFIPREMRFIDFATYSYCDYPSFNEEETAACVLRNETSNYVRKYGFLGLQNVNSTFMNKTLDAPTLKIDGFYFNKESDVYGYDWVNPETNTQPYALPATMQAFVVGTELVRKDYILENGGCQPDGNTWQWGFSFLILFIFMLLLAFWSLGTYIVWLHAHLALKHLGPQHEEVVDGEYTATLRFADALREEFAKTGKDTEKMNEIEIRRHLRYTLHGGSIENPAPLGGDMLSMRKLWRTEIGTMWRKHRWWALAFILTLGISVTLMLMVFHPAAMMFAIAGYGACGGMIVSASAPRVNTRFVVVAFLTILAVALGGGVLGGLRVFENI